MRLSADQIIVDGDTAYVVAEGEPCPGPPHHGFHGPGKDRCSGFRPQPWMTAKCETCDGSGVARCPLPRHHSGPCDLPGPKINDGLSECPTDCIDGKPIHTVEIECNLCRGDSMKYLDLIYCPIDGCKLGIISSYRLVVREVGRILRSTESARPGEECFVFRNVYGWMMFDGYRAKQVSVPPAAKPGNYLAVCDLLSSGEDTQ
jgi:hypothetical protein